MSLLTVATCRFACSWDIESNLRTAERQVRETAAQGARLVLLPGQNIPLKVMRKRLRTWNSIKTARAD